MQICLDDKQGPRFHPARPVSLFWRCWRHISGQILGHHLPQPDKDPQESPDFPSQAGACRDPTQQLRAASDCSKLSSTSSQGLLQQLGLARVHRLFKPPSWPASATSQGCSPVEGTARGCCMGQAPEAQGYWGIPSCKAMDASQGSGSALLLSDRDSSNTHTLLSLKGSCHVLDNPKLSARRNSGKHFLQMTRCCELRF